MHCGTPISGGDDDDDGVVVGIAVPPFRGWSGAVVVVVIRRLSLCLCFQLLDAI